MLSALSPRRFVRPPSTLFSAMMQLSRCWGCRSIMNVRRSFPQRNLACAVGSIRRRPDPNLLPSGRVTYSSDASASRARSGVLPELANRTVGTAEGTSCPSKARVENRLRLLLDSNPVRSNQVVGSLCEFGLQIRVCKRAGLDRAFSWLSRLNSLSDLIPDACKLLLTNIGFAFFQTRYLCETDSWCFLTR